MKRFSHFKSESEFTNEFNSRTARGAALKAASKSENHIILIESDKLYIYDGKKHFLRENEKTEFTESKNIKYKPCVKKLHYEKLSHVCNLKDEQDRLYIKDRLFQIGISI